eukprot:2997019-Rhodomonas_salina.3
MDYDDERRARLSGNADVVRLVVEVGAHVNATLGLRRLRGLRQGHAPVQGGRERARRDRLDHAARGCSEQTAGGMQG